MDESPKPTSTAALLTDISNRLSVIESRLEVVGDHETRIRDLEKARYQSAIIISLFSSVFVAVIVTFISRSI
jgi:hypothetical protein